MNLLGMSMYTDSKSMITMPPRLEKFTYTKLEHGAFDDLLFTGNVVQFEQPIGTNWDNNTILHAKFNNNLMAGNLDYSTETISLVRIKRREKGENATWVTIKEIPITKTEDFSFTYVDRYARSRTEYEYAVVPVMNNIELDYTIGTVYSSFDGIVVCDKEESYQAVADVSVPTASRRNPSSIAEPLDSKYPYVFFNGNTNYDTGSAQGLFVEIDWDKHQFKTANGARYREKVKAFLTNGKPKILKCLDGRIWMIDVTSDPTESVQNHPDQVSISFNFTEIGDVASTRDMYFNNFTDVDLEGS